MYVNKPIYVIALYTQWLIKEANKCEQLSRFFLRNGKFHVSSCEATWVELQLQGNSWAREKERMY